jgi:hypothetical protein
MTMKLPAPSNIRDALLWLVRGDRKKVGRVTALPVEQIDAALARTPNERAENQHG